MTPTDAEQLFQQLRDAHPRWSVRFCSGYVHGARDETLLGKPASGYASGTTPYDLGYITGFVIRRGVDAELERWTWRLGRE